jgi:hypothetical protein
MILPTGWELLPNFGAEEQRDALWVDPRHDRLGILWSLLFHPPSRLIGPEEAGAEQVSPFLANTQDPLARSTDRAAGAAWFACERTFARWQGEGRAIDGPGLATVLPLHDKGMPIGQGAEDDPLGDLARVFSSDDLLHEGGESFLRELHRVITHWPTWAHADWTLKPRLGSSGRGRVAGQGLLIDTPILRGSIPRLAQQGGVILEPFIRERVDLSVQIDIPGDSNLPIHVLGSLAPISTLSGSYLGHRGIWRGTESESGDAHDQPLRQRALRLAEHARQNGFHGPAGVDAFLYQHAGRTCLHICEFNARWTVGHVVHGIARRLAHPAAHWLEPADAFEFRLTPLDHIDARTTIALTERHAEPTSTLTRYRPQG